MKITKIVCLLGVLLFGLIASACSSTPTPDTAATEQAALEATEAARPTDTPPPPTETPTPTATPAPTETPTPTATATPTETPTPTDTPEPTPTPTPTDEPEPTDTPTPAPPTATPTSEISAAELRTIQGFVYMEEEQWEAAIAEFEEAVRLDPSLGVAYEGLGYSYALGLNDLDKAVEALRTYLELTPNAEDRAEVEEHIAQMEQLRTSLDDPVARELAGIDIPEGQALFYFVNYTGEAWIIDVGSYLMEVGPNPPDQEFSITTMFIDPGAYTWQAHTTGGDYIVDQDNNRAFEFSVAAGEAYGTQCCRGPR